MAIVLKTASGKALIIFSTRLAGFQQLQGGSPVDSIHLVAAERALERMPDRRCKLLERERRVNVVKV
jgi:hypothetical protein